MHEICLKKCFKSKKKKHLLMQYPYLHFLQQSCKEKGILHVAFFGFLLWFVGVFCCLGAASGSSSANL